MLRTSLVFCLVICWTQIIPAQEEPTAAGPNVVVPPPNTSPALRKGSDWVGRSKFIRSHWVRLTPNGDLTGKISLIDPNGRLDGVDELTVSVYRKGEKVAETQTAADGSFTFEDLEPGVYALIARGSGGFVAYGLHALASERQAQSDSIHFVQAVEVGETLSISTAAVPPTFEQLRGILRDNFSRIQSNFVPPGEYAALLQEAEADNAAGSDEPEGAEKLRGTDELQRNPTDAAQTRPATTVQVHDVVLERARRGWVIRGRLYGIDPDTGRSVEIEAGSTEVTLIQDDKRVAVDTVRAEGEFDFYGVDEGVYSLVAVGEGGFGAVAFRAVRPPENQASAKDSHIHLVNAGAAGQSMPVAMALIDDPQAILDGIGGTVETGDIVGDAIIQPGMLAQAPPAAPAQSGDFANGGMTSSGGFAGGRALGIAALSTAIALPLALTDDEQRISPFER